MLLLLLRHADAGEHDPTRYPDDTLRELTPKGEKTQRAVSRWLRRHDLVPTLLLSSPWTRAWQTAAIVGETLELEPQACEALAADPQIPALRRAVGLGDAARVVALVGHEPWLGRLGSLLLAGDAGRLTIDFPKSGVLGLETAELASARASLRFFLRPKLVESR